MTTNTSTEFIDQIETLPPFPSVVHRILSATESPQSSAEDVAGVLREDPAVAAKILRVANSSFYGSRREITQLSRATVLLGSVGVRNLVLGVCARDALPVPSPELPEHAVLWRHSVAVASASELIAGCVGFKPPEEAFVAGLLHDIGQLAMVALQPDTFQAVFREHGRDARFLEMERARLGLGHTEAGFRILTRWRLPETLCEVVRQHHNKEVEGPEAFTRLLAVVVIADVLAHRMGFGFDVPHALSKRVESSAERLGLSEFDQLRILSRLERRTDEAFEMLAGTDTAAGDVEELPPKRAAWISPETEGGCSIGPLLLQHRGYEVRRVSPSAAAADLSPNDLVVLAMPEEEAADRLAAQLVGRGCRRIARLSDPAEGAPSRRRDPETGVCRIPAVFTVFDLDWAEEQLQP